MFVNVGACTTSGKSFATKMQLREALRNDPGNVQFIGTANLGPQFTWPIKGNEIPKHVRLTVVGPDPQTNRRWYATVWTADNGNVAIS